MRRPIVAAAALAACIALHLLSGAASGIVVSDDPNLHVVTPPSFYDMIAFLSSVDGSTGVLINPWYIITANHSGYVNDTATFHLAGGTYQYRMAEKFSNPSADMAILRLNSSTGLSGYQLYDPNLYGSEVGKLGTMLGYGMSGTPATVGNGGDPNYPRGTLRIGYNRIDALEPSYYSFGQCLQTDFDSPTTGGTYGSLGADKEVMVAMGDSGGPIFITTGGTQRLAGLAVTVWPRGDANHWPKYGDQGHHVRIGSYLSWINSVLPDTPAPQTGDFNNDGVVNSVDIDALVDNYYGNDMWYDTTSNSVVNKSDSDRLIHTYLSTEYGDANLDGVVDLDDYDILAEHFGLTGSAGWAVGDFNGDKNVNFADYQILEVAYGFGTGSPPPPLPAIPEPATVSLLACGLGLIAARRKRR